MLRWEGYMRACVEQNPENKIHTADQEQSDVGKQAVKQE